MQNSNLEYGEPRCGFKQSTKAPKYLRDGAAEGVGDGAEAFFLRLRLDRERIFCELMTSDRKLKASRQGSK